MKKSTWSDDVSSDEESSSDESSNEEELLQVDEFVSTTRRLLGEKNALAKKLREVEGFVLERDRIISSLTLGGSSDLVVEEKLIVASLPTSKVIVDKKAPKKRCSNTKNKLMNKVPLETSHLSSTYHRKIMGKAKKVGGNTSSSPIAKSKPTMSSKISKGNKVDELGIFGCKKIIQERGIDLDSCIGSYVYDVLKSRNWISWVNIATLSIRKVVFRVCPRKVNEFLNLSDDIESDFLDVDVLENLDLMGKTLCDDDDFVWGKRAFIRQGELTKISAFWHLFVCSNLIVSTNASELNRDKIKIMYALVTNQPINLGELLVEQIQSAACTSRLDKKLAFPGFITQLCLAKGVRNLDGDVMLPPLEKLSEKRMATMSYKDKGKSNEVLRLFGDSLDSNHVPNSPALPSWALKLRKEVEESHRLIEASQRKIEDLSAKLVAQDERIKELEGKINSNKAICEIRTPFFFPWWHKWLESFMRSICAIECIDHMFYVEMNVCIICIHMITLGSPCKRQEVLARVGVTWIAKQEDLPRVGMTRIGKQGVMARVGRTWIVMHGRLPRGKSALDRELANILVGLGVWLDIESDRAGCVGLFPRQCLDPLALMLAWFHSLLGSKTISVDSVVGNSLSSSSVRGSISYADLFKAPPARIDIVSGPSVPSVFAPSKNGGYMATRVDPTAYKSHLKACKFSLIGRVVLFSGKRP
ncbi:hypothetical protein LWI29_023877 [Acer saccharum]|uniref:Putative plant transposon protein domain-containing protein n=1 Tax=Acer saccharum TaxID=4024 RepID=A0AA39S4X8_ACESA|nr:hypothetical protein LWI29_023877 [Acer saccharum]